MTSHRQILKSSAIIGSASIVIVVVGIVKVKVLAVLLGPTGLGLMGLYQNVMSMASTVAGCGINSSGVRQLAASADDARTLTSARRALLLSNLVLGLAGMISLWALRDPVARWVFGDLTHASEIGWLGIGVLLTLIAGSQTALLQGLRQIGDLARISVLSALFGAFTGLLLVYWLGQDGVLWFVVAAPAASILVAAHYAARRRKEQTPYDWQAINHQWQGMLKLGIPLMIGGLISLATQLAARAIILHEIGMDAAGYFQAAWIISMTYIGFVLNAMGTDYFPRLAAAIQDHQLARRLVNEQTEMALLLAGPVLLAMITLAPWIIYLLYANSFAPAIDVLRWQVMGDVLKASSWPMGFILLAQGRGGVFIWTELAWSASYLGAIALGIQEWGLISAGLGFWLAYLIYYYLLAAIAVRIVGYKVKRRVWLNTHLLLLAGLAINLSSAQSPTLGYGVGLTATMGISLYGLARLDDLVGWREKLRQRMFKYRNN